MADSENPTDDSTDTDREYDVPGEGALVRATSLDGEVTGGEVVSVCDDVAEDHLLFEDDDELETVSLYRFWGQTGVEPDEPVVRVQLSGGKYCYPVSKLHEIDEEEAADA